MPRAPLRKAIPWLMLYEVARASKSHWESLDPGDRRRLTELLRKSKGKPQNLSAAERGELRELARRLQWVRLGASAATAAAIGRRRRKR